MERLREAISAFQMVAWMVVNKQSVVDGEGFVTEASLLRGTKSRGGC